MLRKYLFGLFMFALGVSCGLFLDTLITSLFGEKIKNPIAQGAIIVLIVIVTFFLWRLAEKASAAKDKPSEKA